MLYTHTNICIYIYIYIYTYCIYVYTYIYIYYICMYLYHVLKSHYKEKEKSILHKGNIYILKMSKIKKTGLAAFQASKFSKSNKTYWLQPIT